MGRLDFHKDKNSPSEFMKDLRFARFQSWIPSSVATLRLWASCRPIKAGFSHRLILKTCLTMGALGYVRRGAKKCDEVRGKSKYEC
jgi:hypothetical protein